MQKPIRTIVSAAVIAMMANNAANAGSFSLYTESSPAAIGNYAAGIAAEARDASIGWYNPAGLSLIHETQVVSGVVGVFPEAKLSGTTTFETVGFSPYIQTFKDQKGAKPGYVPSFHAALPLGEHTTAGLSVLAPFGLATDWGRAGPLRYAATTSHLLTVNISPELGSQITEHLAVGAGLDLQYSTVKFNTVIGSPALLQDFAVYDVKPTTLDSLSYNKGHSFGVGFHAGFMLLFNDNHTRLGANYQSQMRHRFNGLSDLRGPLASLTADLTSPLDIFAANPRSRFYNGALASNNINFPEVVTVSGYQDVNERIALLGSVVFTGWNSLKTIELDRAAAYAQGLGQVLVNSVTTENYKNAWRFAGGANYKYNDQWLIRVGGGYDQTPTRSRYQRDTRVPDSNRWALSVGAHYQWRPNLGFDAGYTHLFSTGDARINKTTAIGTTSTYNVNVDNHAHADLVGIQAVWSLDQPATVPTK